MLSHKAPTSRSKPPPLGEEEATTVLNLGEFQNVETLSLSEASLVINAIVTKRRKQVKNMNENEILPKTLTCLDSFARFKKKENIEAVERLLSAHQGLAKFEKAQLGSLCCEKFDEAKTIIPSLADKISDEDLQTLLDEMGNILELEFL